MNFIQFFVGLLNFQICGKDFMAVPDRNFMSDCSGAPVEEEKQVSFKSFLSYLTTNFYFGMKYCTFNLLRNRPVA